MRHSIPVEAWPIPAVCCLLYDGRSLRGLSNTRTAMVVPQRAISCLRKHGKQWYELIYCAAVLTHTVRLISDSWKLMAAKYFLDCWYQWTLI